MVADMLEASIIRPSHSSYPAPVEMVPKRGGSWGMCPNYRELNNITVKDTFPVSVINELLEELHGAVIFTKLYLRSRYHHIQMKDGDIPKTTIITH